MPDTNPKRRWYRLTPDRFLVGLLAAEGFQADDGQVSAPGMELDMDRCFKEWDKAIRTSVLPNNFIRWSFQPIGHASIQVTTEKMSTEFPDSDLPWFEKSVMLM